jgi:hypothetical protein
MKRNNRIVVDLSKCQHAIFGYTNQFDQWSYKKIVSCRGLQFKPDDKCFMSEMTLLEHAKRNNLLDVWTPTLILKLTASETLQYTGDKAITMYKAWNERIFNRNKRKGTIV